MDNYRTDYQPVKRWDARFKRIASIMEPAKNKTSSWVESRLKQHLNQIEKELNRDDDLAFVDNLLRYSKGFWKGLFTFYDYPFLPRTNNEENESETSANNRSSNLESIYCSPR